MPPPPSSSNVGDPFADRVRQTHFNEPERPYLGPPSNYASSTTLAHEFDPQNEYQNDDYVEKVPLTSGQAGFYPPRCVLFCHDDMQIHH
jgi:chitin synthase